MQPMPHVQLTNNSVFIYHIHIHVKPRGVPYGSRGTPPEPAAAEPSREPEAQRQNRSLPPVASDSC